MRKILITGSSGFIGKHLVPKLKEAGFEVFAVNSTWGDVANPLTWVKFPTVDIVIHLAGKSFVPASWSDPSSFIKCNLLGTIEALNFCKSNNASLIFLSSYLYGNPINLPIKEQDPINALNPYALSKQLAEEACCFYSKSFSLDISIIRPFNVYGNGQPKDFLIPSLIAQIKNSEIIKVKDLEPKRDYVYIDDLITAIISSVNTIKGYKIFNIGSGTSYSVAELIQILQKIAGTNLPVESVNERRKDEIMNTVADISKAKSELNWQPRISLQDGLTTLIDYYT
jgi:nucleoside-diphosphate-sugar epimerase